MREMKKSTILLVYASVMVLVLSGCSLSSNNGNSNHSGMDHSSHGTEPGTAAASGGSYLDQVIPENVLKLPLVNSDGKTINLDSYKGKWVVATNFLTSCQEICPMTTALLNSIATQVGTKQVSAEFSFIEISVDSKRDSASRLSAYKKIANVNAIELLSGPENSLKKIWAFFGAPYKITSIDAKEAADLPVDWQTGKKATYDVMHPDLVLILSPDQHWRWINLGSPDATHAVVPEKLQAFLSADGKNNLAKPQEPTWTSDSVLAALSDLSGVKIG